MIILFGKYFFKKERKKEANDFFIKYFVQNLIFNPKLYYFLCRPKKIKKKIIKLN